MNVLLEHIIVIYMCIFCRLFHCEKCNTLLASCILASMQYALNMPIAIYSLTQGDTWLMGQTSTAEASSMQHAVK